MKLVPQGVQDEGEGAEEDDEGDDAHIEQGLIGQHVGQLQERAGQNKRRCRLAWLQLWDVTWRPESWPGKLVDRSNSEWCVLSKRSTGFDLQILSPRW